MSFYSPPFYTLSLFSFCETTTHPAYGGNTFTHFLFRVIRVYPTGKGMRYRSTLPFYPAVLDVLYAPILAFHARMITYVSFFEGIF